MIYANVNLTIKDCLTTYDNKIVLYRGDKNVEIRFIINGNRFTVLEETYAQLIIKRPTAASLFSTPGLIDGNTVVLTITQDMIDELGEIGEYTFQIRLYDNEMNARVTLPPCEGGLIIQEPIAIEAESLVNYSLVNYSVASASEEEIEIFDEEGNYLKTEWKDGDVITDVKLNKIEEAIHYVNENGGGGGGTAPYISTSLEETVLVGTDEDFELNLDFSSPNLGKGTLKVFVNDIDVMSTKIDQGETTTTISGSLFAKGTNKLVVYVLDRVGVMSNSLTFYVRYGSTDIVSTFDPYISYDYGATIRYYFTASALDTSKTLVFYMSIDGVVQDGVACTSDVRAYYTFPTNLSVGAHECEAWVFDGTTKSNILAFNLIILDNSSLVVASDTNSVTEEEGAQISLDYKVYMKGNTSFITKTYVDNNLVNTGTCGLETNYYTNSSLAQGTHTVKIEVWDVTETVSDSVVWTVTVTESTYEMKTPISAGSLAIFTAKDRTNSDANKETWEGVNQDGNIVAAPLTNFAFNSESGWIDNELVISGNSWVEVPIAPLANNAKYGFTLDIEFSTKPIGVEDAEVLTLWNDVDDCGIKITTEQLIMKSKSGNVCDLYFSEDEIVSAMFVIDRDEKTAKIYLNGVMCEAFALSDYTANGVTYLEDFTVNSNIFLGGYNKNGYSKIRNLRVYEVALATNEIINNFISNKIDKAEQRRLDEFQKGNDLPTLTVYCDFSGLGKDDKKPCDIVYNSPDPSKYGESFTLDGKYSQLQYQGTSSMQYPIKNYRLNPRNANGKVKLDPFNNGVAESRFTLKADFMSSGHWQNTGLAKWVNDKLYNYKTNDKNSMNARKWYDVQNGGSVNDTREAINGFPCRLILVNDGETPLNEGQQEPTPGNTKDMGVFNFNNDKSNTATLGFDTDIFPNCMSFEVTANSDTSAGAFVPYEGDYYIDMKKSDSKTNYIPLTFFNKKPGDKMTSSHWIRFWNSNYTSLDQLMGNSITVPSDSVYITFNPGIEKITIDGKNIVYSGVENDSVMAQTPYRDEAEELEYLQQSFELRFPDEDDYGSDYGFLSVNGDDSMGLKRVVDWVGNCTDEEFIAEFDQYFHKDYTLRYYLLVITLGMVDNLGKNMMLDTFDGKIWLPRFYDMDTICSYDNSGEIKFDVDIEMEQGYWNTSSSRLWTKIRDLMHDELVEKYKDMRQNGMSYESFMSYFYDQQIAQIPQTYYNKDYDVKYAPYADEYMGKAHGDGLEHLKRWLKRRLIFTDTLFDYAPSYTNDALTIRANTLDLMSLEIETYTPVYQHVSFYNGNMEKIKIDGKTSTIFEGTAQTATDQEVLIYGGSNIKRIKGISTMNPNSMLIGNATRLVELDVSDCPILSTVNSNNANFSPHTYLNKLDISNCGMLGGTLRLNNSPLIQEIDARGTIVTGVQLATSVRNLEALRLPNTISTLTLQDASLLNTLEFDEGAALQSISLTNCNKLTNTINFDLTKTPTVYLDNSYNAEELYMSAITNLTLRNMSNLERVIYTPNNEYETFDIDNVINGSNYEVHTFNNPNMTEFITTAPHRLSYNKDIVRYPSEYKAELLDGTYTEGGYWSEEGVLSGFGFKHYTVNIVPNITTYHIEGSVATDEYIRVTYLNGDTFISRLLINDSIVNQDITIPENCTKIVFVCDDNTSVNSCTYHPHTDYGDITPNTVFTANTLDLSDTQFTDIKFLCTTDLYNLKVPTSMKNFYCDSAMDIDTEVIADASYEIIHDELIEPYTTNYEGEVVRYKEVSNTYSVSSGDITAKNGSNWLGEMVEYIPIIPSSTFKIVLPYDKGNWYGVSGYDGNKKEIELYLSYGTTYESGTHEFTVSDAVEYIRVGHWSLSYECQITLQQAYTPNIIPSSANGSLIFNMYSNNTTQPTSTSPYMWDLTGLKLNDFYTFGMNNWVKPSEDSYVYIPKDIKIITNWTYNPYFGGQKGGYKVISPVIFDENVTGVTLTADDTICFVSQYSDELCTGQSEYKTSLSFTFGSDQLPYKNVGIMLIGKPTWIKVQTSNGEVYMIYPNNLEVVEGGSNITTSDVQAMSSYISNAEKTLQEIQSITMPQRLPGYSVRMVNADITPNNYATHLYPLLVDTTLPITGKLDYTKYNGNTLAWAYAYTTNDVSIDPLGSGQQGNITNDYNKLYGTDFVDIVDVWAYKDDDFSSKSTNEAITKAYIELTSTNYKTRIDEVLQWYPNCHDIYLFDDGSVTSLSNMYNKTNNQTTVSQVQNVIFIDGYFNNLTNMQNCFREVQQLVTVSNIPNNVTTLKGCFLSCFLLESVSNLPERAVELESTFQLCQKLTTVPNISSGVTNMNSTFNGCASLTTIPNIPNGVTSMNSTFYDCKTLTTVPNIPNSVTNMNSTFFNCRALTTAPNIGNNVTDMVNTFRNCSALTTAPTIPNSVTNMSNTFQGCTSLTTAPIIPNSCTSIVSIYDGCSNLTNVTIPLHVTGYASALNNCGFTNITWEGERQTDFYLLVGGLSNKTYTQADIQELVPEHLATVESATLTLGEKYLAYLTEEEITAATNKGWTLQ